MRIKPRTVDEIYEKWPENQSHGLVFDILQEIAVQLAGLRHIVNLNALAQAVFARDIMDHLPDLDEEDEDETKDDGDLADAGRPAQQGYAIPQQWDAGRVIPFPAAPPPPLPRWPWACPDPRFPRVRVGA